MTNTAVSVELPAPTSSPPAEPQKVILWENGQENMGQLPALETELTSLVSQNGLSIEKKASLAPADLANAKLVVVLGSAPDLPALAKNAPQIQFLAVNIPGIKAGGNISVLQAPEGRQEFMAGATAALLTTDWRIAMIHTGGDAAAAGQQAYFNGAKFFCGLCRPVATFRDPQGKYITYPFAYELQNPSDPASIQVAVQYLTDRYVKTVYVSQPAASQALFDALANAKIGILSGQLPENTDKSSYIASLQFDPRPGLQGMLPKLLSGAGGIQEDMGLGFFDVNSGNFSEGRQQAAMLILQDLNQGFIDIGTMK